MNIESGFSQVAQSLLWPVLVLVGLAFVYALWVGGATLMEAWQRWRQRVPLTARGARPVNGGGARWCARWSPCACSAASPMLGLIATMIAGPALQSGGGQQAAGPGRVQQHCGVVLALAAASVGLVVYSVRRRWLLAGAGGAQGARVAQ